MHISLEPSTPASRCILLVSMTNFLGGGEVFCCRLAKLLAPDIATRAVVRFAGLQRLMQEVGHSRLLAPGANTLMTYVNALRAVYAEVRLQRPDIIMLNGQGDAYLTPLLKPLGIPILIVRHTRLELESGPLKRMLYRINARLASSVISVAKKVQEEQADFLPSAQNLCIENWIAKEWIKPPKTFLEGSVLRVAYSGRLVAEKGVPELCSALCNLEGVKLTMFGDGPLLDGLRKEYAHTNITFAGFVSDFDERYQNADLFVLPSHSEAMPQSVLEASAYGLPCLLSDIPAHRELSEEGAAALLYKVGDAAALREAVLTLQRSPHMLTDLAKKGQHLMLSHHTQAAARNKYLSAFEKVWK